MFVFVFNSAHVYYHFSFKDLVNNLVYMKSNMPP